MRFKPAYIAISLACVLVGFIVATQFKVVKDMELSQRQQDLDRSRTLAAEVDEARKKNDMLQEQVEQLRKQLDEAVDSRQLADLRSKLDEVRSYAGFTELEGPGVLVTLNDSQETIKPGDDPNLYILHDEDVIRVLNELKAAGAEALSMNGHRIISTTEVRCIGPTVLMNKSVRLTPPFVIKAIGDPDTIINALKMKQGLIDSLKLWGIQVKVEKAENLVIPPYEGGLGFNFARPVK